MNTNIHTLIDLLKQSTRTVVFTGAGVSTLAGIPDFRGPKGIYRDTSIDAERLFDLDAFMQDPSYYYAKTCNLIYKFDQMEPALVHTECARLEQEELIAAVITQNIDMLHHRAGSKRVLELHGSPQIHTCLDCQIEYSYASVLPTARTGKTPTCQSCGGPLKPNITFFGEMLDQEVLAEANRLAREADLMLVCGSSLTVYPAADLPLQTLRSGGSVAIINAQDTWLDDKAVWKHDDLDETFRALARHTT